MAAQRTRTRVSTNPYLWVLVLVSTGVAVLTLGIASGVGVFAGGVIGVLALAVAVRLFEEFRTPKYDGKIDPWDD